jgi:3-deoxy-manno-octulosonate cytidylyltransferase (CMP-KDO synthetase)
VIPARWASTRFPGKILAPLCGKPMVQWVLERALQATELESVVVATDDTRIRDAVVAAGGDAVMTRNDHPSGTDRVAEALTGTGAAIVVNIQGDEPLVDPALIDQLVRALRVGDEWAMATAAAPITDHALLDSPDVVKVVTDRAGGALYFSRHGIPYVREKGAGAGGQGPLHWRHIGIYAYRSACLEALVRTPPCATEAAEKLEQLRALDLGFRIKVLRTEDVSIGVDTPGDLAAAEQALRQAGLA